MASRALAAPQQQNKEGIQKIKAAAGGRARNRRVLQDIGNHVFEKTGKAGDKPNTRRQLQSLVNLREQADKKKKPVNEINATKIQETEPEVIVISSDEESRGKEKSVARRKVRERKNVNTLSSILNDRSKAACGLPSRQKNMVDIDAADVENELAAVEYIDDMFKFYKLAEDQHRIIDYIGSQPDIIAKMRSILVDWLLKNIQNSSLCRRHFI